jgi:hypothetical protein
MYFVFRLCGWRRLNIYAVESKTVYKGKIVGWAFSEYHT